MASGRDLLAFFWISPNISAVGYVLVAIIQFALMTDPLLQLILPFTIGVYCLSSHQYSIDPVLALVSLSEYTFMNWSRIREPYIRRLLNKRAMMVLFFTVLLGVCLIVLFIFVPGKRL